MKWVDLLAAVEDEPVFDSSLLLAGSVQCEDVRRQLSRWHAAGKLVQLRRGVYSLAPPWQKVVPHPFVVANHLVRGSYVSRESVLAHHGLIPEHVPTVTSVGVCRPGLRSTPLGACDFRHVSQRLAWGYRREEVAPHQWAFVATPEKALLDVVHLRSRGDSAALLDSLRLQNLEGIDAPVLLAMAERTRSPKLVRAARRVIALAAAEADDYRAA